MFRLINLFYFININFSIKFFIQVQNPYIRSYWKLTFSFIQILLNNDEHSIQLLLTLHEFFRDVVVLKVLHNSIYIVLPFWFIIIGRIREIWNLLKRVIDALNHHSCKKNLTIITVFLTFKYKLHLYISWCKCWNV